MTGLRQGVEDTVAREIGAWFARLHAEGVPTPNDETVIGGAGVRLTLGEYLTLLEWVASEYDVDVAVLLRLRPPYTVRALARAALESMAHD